jgi:hypothetical protein
MSLVQLLEHISKQTGLKFEENRYEFKYYDEETTSDVPSVISSSNTAQTMPSHEENEDPLQIVYKWQKQFEHVEKAVYSKRHLDMSTVLKNLAKRDIELIHKPNELNGGIIGKHSVNRDFSIEEHI